MQPKGIMDFVMFTLWVTLAILASEMIGLTGMARDLRVRLLGS